MLELIWLHERQNTSNEQGIQQYYRIHRISFTMESWKKHSDYGQSSEMPDNICSYMDEEYSTSIAESTGNTSIQNDVQQNIPSSFGIVGAHFSSFSIGQTADGQLPFNENNEHDISGPSTYDLIPESHLFHNNPPNFWMDEELEPCTHRSDESPIVFSTSVHSQLDESSPNNVPPSFEDYVRECAPNWQLLQANASQPNPEVDDHHVNSFIRDVQINENCFHPYVHYPDGRMEYTQVSTGINTESETLSDRPSMNASLPTELSESFSNMHTCPANPERPFEEGIDHPFNYPTWDQSIPPTYLSDNRLPNLEIGQQTSLPYTCLGSDSANDVNAGPSASSHVHYEMFNNSQHDTQASYFGTTTGDHAQGLQMNQYCDAQQNFFPLEQRNFPHSRDRGLQHDGNAEEFLPPLIVGRPVQHCVNLDQNGMDRNRALHSSNFEDLGPITTVVKPLRCRDDREESFSGQKYSDTNKRAIHSEENTFLGQYCGETLSSGADLNQHEREVHEEKPFHCEICEEQFPWQYQLANHMQAVHGVEKPFQCDVCQKSFLRKCTLNEHRRLVHGRERPFECDICHKTYPRRTVLNNHKRAVHDKERPFQCDVCQKSFSQKYTLELHRRLVHDKARPFECDICHKTFQLRYKLIRHNRFVHDEEQRPFECDICHKTFLQPSDLDSHNRFVHDKERPFDCDICHKTFPRRSELNKHNRFVHDKERPFECEICHKTFPIRSTLNRHNRFVHDEESRPFE